MGLSYNISYTITSIVICAVLLFVVSVMYSSTNIVSKRYKYFLISAIVMFIFNICTVLTIDFADRIPVDFNIFLNGMYFLSATVVALLFLYYCGSVALINTAKEKRRIFGIINLSLLVLFVISLILNHFLGFYFNFFNGEYTHGVAYYFVDAVFIIFVLESLVLFIIKRKKFNNRQKAATILFYVSFFAMFILQLVVFPKVLLSDFGTALGALLVFFSVETPDYINLVKTLEELNELKASLEIQVTERTKELDREKESYEILTLETLSSLAVLVDAKDHYTNGHSFRVAAYAKGMAKMMGQSADDVEQLYFAGLIHDVGKVGISETILTKPGKLTDKEFEVIKSHSAVGGEILKGIKEFKIFQEVARSHHERFDGKGYPDKLKGEEIPLPARIVTVCDTFDAMTSDRVYRKALKDEVALKELIDNKGTQFDPELVDIFIKLYKSFPDSIRNHIDELKE